MAQTAGAVNSSRPHPNPRVYTLARARGLLEGTSNSLPWLFETELWN